MPTDWAACTIATRVTTQGLSPKLSVNIRLRFTYAFHSREIPQFGQEWQSPCGDFRYSCNHRPLSH
jgi:hypothetical protein